MMSAAILLPILVVAFIPVGAVYGHGLGLDTAPPVTISGEKISVTVEMPMEFDQTDRRITITATELGGAIPNNVTFLVNVMYGGAIILQEHFFVEDGILVINATPSDGIVEISGQKQGPLDAWHSLDGTPFEITGPVFQEPGLYTFEIEIRTIYDATAILAETETHRADLMVAGSTPYAVQDSMGDETIFKLKSYFDRISNFSYDPDTGTIIFDMPFDWSRRVISHVPVVHVEVHFPKDFSEYHSPSYDGMINGIDLFRSSVTVDDYSGNDERIVHFVLLNDHIIFLKNQLQKSDEPQDGMRFVMSMNPEAQFPITGYTRGEEFSVDLTWDPPEIVPDQSTNFIFTIRDGVTGEPMRRSTYDFVLLQNDQEIYRAHNEAQVGGSFERFTFSEGQTGPTVIRFENIRGTGATTEFSTVVVPEFGVVTVLILAIAMISIVAMRGRLWSATQV